MKKKLAAVLLLMLAFSLLAACGGSSSSAGSKPKAADNKMQSALDKDGKEAQVKLFIPPGDIVTVEQLNEEKAELDYFQPYDDTLNWIKDKLSELGFVSTVSEETRKSIAPSLLTEVFTGTIDGQPLTLVIYNTPPPVDGEEHFTPVFIYFYAVVI